MAQTCANLRDAAATGDYYDALVQFKTMLNRKCNLRKDRAACVQLVCDGVKAIWDAAGQDEARLDRLAAAATDVANQITDVVFPAFGAKFDSQAVADVEKVVVIVAQLTLRAPTANTAATPPQHFAAAQAFADRCMRWSRDKATVRGPFNADHEHCFFAWCRGVALWSVPSTRAEALPYLINATALPLWDAVPDARFAAVLANATLATADRGAEWFAARAALQLLSARGTPSTAAAALEFVRGYLAEIVQQSQAADAAEGARVMNSVPLHWLRLLFRAADVGAKDLAAAAVAEYEPAIGSVDPKLVQLATHALAAINCA